MTTDIEEAMLNRDFISYNWISILQARWDDLSEELRQIEAMIKALSELGVK